MRGVRQHAGPAASIVAHALEAVPGPLRHVVEDITPFDPKGAGLSGPPSPAAVAGAAGFVAAGVNAGDAYEGW